MKYSDFINTRYKPKEDDLICLFRIEPAKGFSFKEAAARVASESSTGTWAELNVPKHVLRRSAKAFHFKPPFVKIAYPLVLFELGSIPQVMSSIAGNIFGMKAVSNIRLEDITWPQKMIRSFPGPQFGIKGIRKIFGVKKRPILASVPKPKVGINTGEFCKIAENAWRGGCDLVKDDENLTDQTFNRFENRLTRLMKLRKKIEKDTGEKKSYLANITSETKEMLRRAKLVKKLGNEYIMVDILTAGWAAVQTVRNECQDLKLAIHAHRAFHAAFDRNPRHGLSMKVVAEISRLQGVDQVHIGGLGKLAGSRQEVYDIWDKVSSQKIKSRDLVLEQDWGTMKPVMGTSSGGVHPGITARLLELLSTDIVIQAGGGIHGHPQGTYSGAIAMRAALDAFTDGISVTEKAKSFPELAVALKKWGHATPS